MANWYDNPFAPKPSLGDLLNPSTPALPVRKPSFDDIVKALSSSSLSATPTWPSPRTGLGNALYTPGLFGSLAPPSAPVLPVRPASPAPAPVKRKGFFSFHFDDLLRVNNVRNAWKIGHPDKPFMRNFYDRSLWESKKRESDDALKALIRQGMAHSSVVCVLVGSGTWARRWVKYEIARAVIDRKGLLAVHINALNHHQRRQPDPLGYNPLHLMGIYKSADGRYFLYEKREVVVNIYTGQTEWQWHPYRDYQQAVSLPRYLHAPSNDHVMPLSWHTDEYDYVKGVGHKNLGTWIDRAAIRASR